MTDLIQIINNPWQAVSVTSIVGAAAFVAYTLIDRVLKCRDAEQALEIPKDE